MQIMFPRKIAMVVVLTVAAIGVITAKGFVHQNTSTPQVFEVSPPNAGANQQVTLTVVLDQPTATGEVVSIGCTDPQAFTDLPQYVTVPAGEVQTSFSATTSSVFTDWTVLAATANGGTALAIPR